MPFNLPFSLRTQHSSCAINHLHSSIRPLFGEKSSHSAVIVRRIVCWVSQSALNAPARAGVDTRRHEGPAFLALFLALMVSHSRALQATSSPF